MSGISVWKCPFCVTEYTYAHPDFPENHVKECLCRPKPKDLGKDMVNQPPHYTSGNIEVIDILKDQMTPEEFEGFLKGNVLKYTLRYRLKNGIQDIEKAQWYLKKLVELKKDPK